MFCKHSCVNFYYTPYLRLQSEDDFRLTGGGHLAVGRSERYKPPQDGIPLFAENWL